MKPPGATTATGLAARPTLRIDTESAPLGTKVVYIIEFNVSDSVAEFRDHALPGHPKIAMEFAQVTCPTCFEVFEVAVPHPDEMPAEVDYDCEICCRPMIIVFTEQEVYAKGLGE
ncbi:MAG: CPXCG motif-containing cysteine-rich protein [Verrucomicrobiota bacterium]